jgi:outer membrane protein assembly factor BamD
VRRPALLLAALPLVLLACGYAADPQTDTVEGDFEAARQEYENRHFFDAVIKFTDFIREHPGSVYVDQAIYYRGMSHVEQKDWVMAATDFERLVRDFPESRFACDAQYWLAETYWRQSRKPPYDQYETETAIVHFERFAARCPQHELAAQVPERLTQARERLAEKLFQSAILYEKRDYYDSAVIYLTLVIEDYFDTRWATKSHEERFKIRLKLWRLDGAREDLEWLKEYEALDQSYLDHYERQLAEAEQEVQQASEE